MHKRLWNVSKLEFKLVPRGPLLIKSGALSPNPSLPDMQFVRTMTVQGEMVFIPGSSLKGVFRSFTEKVLRTANASWACDPFAEDACGHRLSEFDDTARIYRESCYACKLYGHTRLRGRLVCTDAYPEDEVKTEIRYGVAISRLTHAVSVGPFDMEVLVEGSFTGSFVLENFEVWQLGLLALTFQAINDGLVKIGFGKNRGFGEVSLTPTRIIIEMAKRSDIPKGEIWGVGKYVSVEERERYGLKANDLLTGLPKVQEENLAIFVRRQYTGDHWRIIAEKATASLSLLEVRT